MSEDKKRDNTPKEIIATAKYISISPLKVRVVADLVRNLPLEEAAEQLRNSIKKAAKPLYKVLMSAAANAENNLGLKREDLEIKEIQVSPGPTAKRVRFRAKGRRDIIRKRSSQIRVVLKTKV